jgi:hypothetical protein
MRREELERVRAWAAAKIASADDSRSTCHDFVKLRDALDAILSEIDKSSATQLKGACQRFVESARKL